MEKRKRILMDVILIAVLLGLTGIDRKSVV